MEYLIPQELINLILSEFTFSEAKLLITLIGNKEGFRVSMGFLKNCGLSESSYKAARKSLLESGIIVYDPYKSIGVNFQALYEKIGVVQTEENEPTLDEITQYIEGKEYTVNPKKFFKYYEERDWIAKNGVKIHDWRKTVDEWNKRNNTSKTSEKRIIDNNSGERSPIYDIENDVIDYFDESTGFHLKRHPTEEEKKLRKVVGK